MPNLKRRTRTVSFRLSQEEYQVIQDRCISEGARSISDWARALACGPMNGASQLRHDMETEAKLHQMRERIEELESDLRRVVKLIEPLRPVAKIASSRADFDRSEVPQYAAGKEE
jgi:hypothetical protein